MGTNPQATVEAAFAAYQKCMESGSRDFSEMRAYFDEGYMHSVVPDDAGRLSGDYESFDEFVVFLRDSASAPGFRLDQPRFEESDDIVHMRVTVNYDAGTSNDHIVFRVVDGKITEATHTIGDPALAAKLYPVASD